jgi:hypothetical protein
VAVRRSMVRVPDIKPEALDAAWRRAVNESLGGLFRKPEFLDNYSPAIEQYGVPPDADTCSSFAGPPGMSNVLGTSFARADGGTTLFVFWTDATALMGARKRDQVHETVLDAVSRFPGAVELTEL